MRSGLAFLVLIIGLVGHASAMPVSSFVAKADGLKAKGPLALFSGDLKLLVRQIKQDAAALRAENAAAVAAGRPKAYCTPDKGVSLDDEEIVNAMKAVPVAQRSRTQTKDVLRAHLARRFPCRA